MRLDFRLQGLEGSVDVTVSPNEDPVALGCRPDAKGFPVCTASVACRCRGYAAMFGWIQLVRSTDNASGGSAFEMDPYEPLGVLTHPFCWFGQAPTLFDAPSRRTLDDVDWIAHSFLCCVAQPREAREARAIVGFSWGFAIDRGEISIADAAALDAERWNEHLPILRREYPTWRFASGYGRR